MEGYVDGQRIQEYQQQFDRLFYRTFACSADKSVLFRSRFRTGVVVYHSLVYSLRKQSSSFNVCVSNTSCPKKKCFGEIVFFFSYRNELFLLLSFHPCSRSHSFSAAVTVDSPIPCWSERLDSFYHLVDRSLEDFAILPCATLLSKCFFFPFIDDRFLICTPVDNELEHD